MSSIVSWFTSGEKYKPFVILAITATVLGCVRWIFPERTINTLGLRAVLDLFFTCALTGFVLLTAWSVGKKLSGFIRIEYDTKLESVLINISLGLGGMAYGIGAMGMLQLLYPRVILLWLVFLALWVRHDYARILYDIRVGFLEFVKRIKDEPTELKVLAAAVAAIFYFTLLQALTPPWDVDGLIYHLQVPRTWLSSGGIQPQPRFWEANYPMTIELIYSIGLAFGSDTFAKVIHSVYAVILVLGSYSFARRFSNPRYPWIAPAILVGIPIFPIWASASYTDMGWAVYEFFSLYGLILWWQTQENRFLVLSGLLSGFAIGCKYPALASSLILGGCVLWQSRSYGLRRVLLNGTMFGLITLAVGAPWYIKNYFWFQNPVYPLSFGGLFSSGAAGPLWMSYMWDGFGTGKRLIDFLLIPWNLFAHLERFSTFAGSIEIPSPLFLLAFLYPLFRRSKVYDQVAILAGIRFIVWMFGVQQTRLLLPLFPWLSLLTGEIFVNLANNNTLRRYGREFATGIVGGMVAATLVYSLLFLGITRPLGVILGFESKKAFLSRMVSDYPAMQFIQNNLPPQSRVLLMWDGRGYYCDSRCLPDADHSHWTELVMTHPEVTGITTSLAELGVTHLMLSMGDADFILQHDPKGLHLQAFNFFFDQYLPACTREVFRDEWVRVFEITCNAG